MFLNLKGHRINVNSIVHYFEDIKEHTHIVYLSGKSISIKINVEEVDRMLNEMYIDVKKDS